ncbi:unnamed protein product [Paramecium primaurelia]|uniref:Uncharacterized protein n=1 Tax=Paramecium primaurelia TaxID=5886 RepID=A0A8S1NCS8_PARPR|nr:unnamed protein product [Paramecium primaurelia]
MKRLYQKLIIKNKRSQRVEKADNKEKMRIQKKTKKEIKWLGMYDLP